MTRADIDTYLADLDGQKRVTLEQVRRNTLAALPNAEECISYGMPAFRFRGKTVTGFAAFGSHLSYLPHSDSVLSALEPEPADYEHTKGSLHFPLDQALPASLVNKLISTPLAQLGLEA